MAQLSSARARCEDCHAEKLVALFYAGVETDNAMETGTA
jgi:hypothetical protein